MTTIDKKIPIDDYPANPKIKPDPVAKEEKSVEQITTGTVRTRKQPVARRVGETFLGGDARTVGQHIVLDVLLPATKNLISDMVTEGINRLLFGDNAPRGGSRRSYTSYGSYYTGSAARRDGSQRQMSSRARRMHDFEELVFDSRLEAESVLERMRDIIEQYDMASVADLYSLAGVSSNYVDNNWGWRNLAQARTRQVREGFLLELPRAEELK